MGRGVSGFAPLAMAFFYRGSNERGGVGGGILL